MLAIYRESKVPETQDYKNTLKNADMVKNPELVKIIRKFATEEVEHKVKP